MAVNALTKAVYIMGEAVSPARKIYVEEKVQWHWLSSAQMQMQYLSRGEPPAKEGNKAAGKEREQSISIKINFS